MAVFAVAGTQKALGYGLNPLMSALLGMLTGIGGGMVRDVLVSEIPTVLRTELYAIAALIGAHIYLVTRLGTTSVPQARGESLDRDRRPRMRERPVVRVGAIARSSQDQAPVPPGVVPEVVLAVPRARPVAPTPW